MDFKGRKMTSTNGLNLKVKRTSMTSQDECKSLKNLRKKNAHPKRTCRICGKDPYPNYFFCPSCHYKVSTLEE